MDMWQRVAPNQVMSFFDLPAHVAHSEDHHFYIPHNFETDDYFTNDLRYQALGFIRPRKKYDYVSFRFWNLHPDWMYSDPNILEPGWSGRIDIYHSEIDDLIKLLLSYGDTLRSIGMKDPTFQLIPQEDYEKFHIDKPYIEKRHGEKFYNSQKVNIYLCSEPIADDYDIQVHHKIVALVFEGQKIALRVMLTPKHPDPAFAFHNGWTFGGGWINLTKQGIAEFCQLLLNKP